MTTNRPHAPSFSAGQRASADGKDAANRSLLMPVLGLPKGGGAIRGLGERFGTNAVYGTAGMTVPLPVSPARSGATPALSLSYDSAAESGPFGLGWRLPVAQVSRKTSRGVPKYDDTDVFVLAGGDDLVAALDGAGKPVVDGDSVPGYRISRYHQRVEGTFTRIERWARISDGDVHWRTLSADNTMAVFGRTPAERISDPADQSRVFSWLLSETRDAVGNAVVYEYLPEDGAGVDVTRPHEVNRQVRSAGRYLKRVRYGNRVPLLDARGRRPVDLSDEQRAGADWLFEIVFDYGDHAPADPVPAADRPWTCRQDALSSYRSGFEVRTYRLCQRMLMFHHFPLEPGIGANCLVAALELGYTMDRLALLSSVVHRGYVRRPEGGYDSEAFPPTRFEYTQASVDGTVREIDPSSLENAPAGLDADPNHWVDLYGQGMPGLLTEHQNTWYYKQNLGGGRFGPQRVVPDRPPTAQLRAGRQALVDLTGDGRLDLVQLDGTLPGLAAGTDGRGWRDFVPFATLPELDFAGGSVQLVDLTGDGMPDILVTEDDAFVWYRSLGERGFAEGLRVALPTVEERGPRLLRADAEQAVFLADMSGDGLMDLVRVRATEICYWPSLGHGRFGRRVLMSRCPALDRPDQFDARGIRLADVDGSGSADLIYLGRDLATVWFNETGNSWSEPVDLPRFPHLDDLSAVTVADLLGRGTACLVWSTPAVVDATRPLRYIDLMSAGPPRLLSRVTNSMGAETRVRYAPSTRFFVDDQLAGQPWLTRLPFPVHVVEQTEVVDHVSGSRLTSRYAYHHGYFDGVEREFRGFALVEQFDTEAFEDYVAGVERDGGHMELAPELYQPPVTVRSWFHTGAFEDGEDVAAWLRAEFHQGRQDLMGPEFPPGLSTVEYREAVRALKGSLLRQETYSFDGTPAAGHPYSVVEHRYAVRRVQPGVSQPIAVETLTTHYDRDPDDPRVEHAFVLRTGRFGQPLESAAVSYGRRRRDPALPDDVAADQARTWIVCHQVDEAPEIDTLAPVPAYRLPAGCETRSYQLTGVTAASSLFTADELRVGLSSAVDVDYFADPGDDAPRRRLLSRARTLYRGDDLAALPFGQQGTLGLTHQSYRLAFTQPVIDAYYTGMVGDADWTAAGYLRLGGEDGWWIPFGTAEFPAEPSAHFYLPEGARDPFGVRTVVTLDRYDLLVERTSVVGADWNTSSVVNDYRVLGPVELTDVNQNRTAVLHDALGFVVRTAVMGKVGSTDGDTLADPTTTLQYDLTRWTSTGLPNVTHVRARERHGAADTGWRESFVYATGSGGVALVKTQAPGGWLATGRTVVNNKGNPVKQYEPYFSPTQEYDDFEALATVGVTPVISYDPIGRAIRTDLPDGTHTTIEFHPWRQVSADANDTVLDSRWYVERGSPDPAGPEPADPRQRAAWLAARHARTPFVTHLDVLGRPVLAVSDYGDSRTATVRSRVDLTGRHSSVTDQLGREVATGFASMIGTPVFGSTAERGSHWMFLDVAGNLVRAWDSHGRTYHGRYDSLRRPLGLSVSEAETPESLLTCVVYGDRHPDALARNLNGVVHQTYDQAGAVTVDSVDFKGIPLSVSRSLTRDPTTAPDWGSVAAATGYAGAQAAAGALLDPDDVYTASGTYDALGRPIQLTLADGTVVVPTYDRASRLAGLSAQIGGTGPSTVFLVQQSYDAKGQRLSARHGNDVTLRYGYDPNTFRLTDLLTAAPAGESLQKLGYTYDPVGNVTQIDDDAQQTYFFANSVVTPQTTFTYDALYQLVTATGRELAAGNDTIRDAGDLGAIVPLPHVNDDTAVRRYTEYYSYDLAGNVTQLRHAAPVTGGSWTRHYRYRYQTDPADATNRLAATSLPGDSDTGPYTKTYDYDPYGNFSRLRTPTPGELVWNAFGQLQQVDLGGGNTAYYRYGADGHRVRKVVQRPGGLRTERIYLGAVEIYREKRAGADPTLIRHTVHISDDTGRIAQVDVKIRDTAGVDPDNPLGTPVIRYQYGNHLGSAVLETDDTGAVLSYEEYHPFGTTAYRSSKSSAGLSLKRYRFSGKERDDETGLYYFGARYYAPWLGRWTSPDPAGFADGLNQWRYCRNNPIALRDGDGRQSQLGQVSWEVPSSVFVQNGVRLPDSVAVANFEAWVRQAHPERSFTPGTVTIDWSTFRAGPRGRGPTFNAQWIEGGHPLPQPGDFGHVAPMQQQPPAEYVDPTDRSTRLTENEHTTPHAQAEVIEPGYDQRAYRRDATVRSPRGVSLDKTRGDNARSAALQARASAGQPINITEDVDLAGNAEFHQANEAARAAGRPHIPNPGSINRGTLEQMGRRFERGRNTPLPPGTVIEEPDIRPYEPPAPPRRGFFGPGFATNVGGTLARTFVPGFAEAEVVGIFAHPFVVGTLGITSGPMVSVAEAISAAPTTFAASVTAPLFGGAIAGNAVESLARRAGAGEGVSIGAAVLAAAGTGALIGTLIPIPGVGTATGAVIGAAIGLIGYGLSKLF